MLGTPVLGSTVVVRVGRGVLSGTGADEVTRLVGVGVGRDDRGIEVLGTADDDDGGVVEPLPIRDCSLGARSGLGVDVSAGAVSDGGGEVFPAG